jgi:hypothetical protein
MTLTDISREALQFLNFETCDRNKFLKFDFKSIAWTQEKIYIILL